MDHHLIFVVFSEVQGIALEANIWLFYLDVWLLERVL
jgi:hypothetical protein